MEERLFEASENGDLSTVIKLLKKLPLVPVNAQDAQGDTALIKACRGMLYLYFFYFYKTRSCNYGIHHEYET